MRTIEEIQAAAKARADERIKSIEILKGSPLNPAVKAMVESAIVAGYQQGVYDERELTLGGGK